MKFVLPLVALMLVGVGCQNKKQSASLPSNDAVVDITPPPTQTYVAPAPTYAPPVQPVVTDTVTTATPAVGGTYTVKKGDTLFSIARTTYGDAKQWKKIADANGITNERALRIGQTLTLP